MKIPIYYITRACPYCHHNAEMPVYERQTYKKSDTADVLVPDELVNLAECPACGYWFHAPEYTLPW